MKRQRQFGELELAILEVLKTGAEFSVREVVDALPKLAYTTVLTVMNRLVEKGELERQRDGRRHLYRVAAESRQPRRGPFKRLKERLFGDRSAAMISYLIEEADDLSEADLDALQARIQAAREKQGSASS